MDSASLVERALDQLRAAGGRVTEPRRAVLRALVEAGPHPDADTIAAVARRYDSNVHLATVYRTLDLLQDMGVIAHVHLGHGRSTFHLAGEVHHHAVCEICSAVIEVPHGHLDALAQALESDHGFVADTHHFAIVGRCRDCR
jgi:Fur family transcriptional regulator, ferric uptake regulator